MNYDKLLNATTRLGYILLENGAETYRVEESMMRIFGAYGIVDADVFVIPTMIIVSITPLGLPTITQQKRVHSRGTNLYKVQQANSLCRQACRVLPTTEDLERDIAAIDRSPAYPALLQFFAYGLAAFAFALFFRGSFSDALWAGLCGIMIKGIFIKMGQWHANPFFINVVASAAVTAVAMGSLALGLCADSDKVTIGAIMLLVPGVALTNFMRDTIAADYVSGLTKLLEAILIGTGIALGTYISMTVFIALTGV